MYGAGRAVDAAIDRTLRRGYQGRSDRFAERMRTCQPSAVRTTPPIYLIGAVCPPLLGSRPSLALGRAGRQSRGPSRSIGRAAVCEALWICPTTCTCIITSLATLPSGRSACSRGERAAQKRRGVNVHDCPRHFLPSGDRARFFSFSGGGKKSKRRTIGQNREK